MKLVVDTPSNEIRPYLPAAFAKDVINPHSHTLIWHSISVRRQCGHYNTYTPLLIIYLQLVLFHCALLVPSVTPLILFCYVPAETTYNA
ncbi:hypothetical protein AMECASPLE_007357 [Ameca splendens]|uniref:Uncharacterized protein n=1 Tax=Ameca splendens TaxID=208324 RepID=A0ABV0XCR7_9TELE